MRILKIKEQYNLTRREWERGKMDYKLFVENMVSLLQERMGDDYEVRATEVIKNNDIRLTGVVMMREADQVCPTIYLEEPYRIYCAGADLQEVAERIVALHEEQIQGIHLDMSFFQDYEYVKDRIFHKLINYEKNRTLLDDVPHIRWNDLALVFYYGIEEQRLGRASILIHNNHMDMWGQSADMLYQVAQHNMKQNMPELFMPMQKMIEDMLGIGPCMDESVKLYVLSNRDKLFGASAMLYSESLGMLAEQLQSDLLILPSSVHEVLVLPDNAGKRYEGYMRMVEEVNMTQVEPEEILSCHLYRYSREKAEIEEIIV